MAVGFMGQYFPELGIDSTYKGLVSGGPCMGALLGCVVATKLADTSGRKPTIATAFAFKSLGWLLVTLSSSNLPLALSGRIIHGVGEGLVVSVSTSFLGEIVSKSFRGAAIATLAVTFLFGIALVYILGLFLTWQQCAGLLLGKNILCLLLSGALKESSEWQNLQKVLDDDDNIDTSTTIDQYAAPNLVSTIIPPILLFIFPLTGNDSIAFYALDIMRGLGFENPEAVSIVLCLVRTIGSLCGIGFVQKLGRRKSLIVSAVGAMFSLMAVALLIQEHSTDDDSQLTNTLHDLGARALALLLFLCLASFIISIGMGSVPWILLGEWPNIQNKVFDFLKIIYFFISYFSGYC